MRYGRAKFEYNGKIEIGRIVQVSPADWDERGVMPTVYVSQGAPTDIVRLRDAGTVNHL